MFETIKNNKKISIAITILLLSAVGYTFLYINDQKNEIIDEIVLAEENQEVILEEEIKKNIIVDIGGEVEAPGVYELQEGARINDLVTIAGGLTEKACLDNVNLAYKLSDGMKIIIPQKEVKKTITTSTAKPQVIQSSALTSGGSNLININTATIAELDKLEGIGETTAKKIINYREKIGEFKKKEEIMNVSGIGEAKYNNIKNEIEI